MRSTVHFYKRQKKMGYTVIAYRVGIFQKVNYVFFLRLYSNKSNLHYLNTFILHSFLSLIYLDILKFMLIFVALNFKIR